MLEKYILFIERLRRTRDKMCSFTGKLWIFYLWNHYGLLCVSQTKENLVNYVEHLLWTDRWTGEGYTILTAIAWLQMINNNVYFFVRPLDWGRACLIDVDEQVIRTPKEGCLRLKGWRDRSRQKKERHGLSWIGTVHRVQYTDLYSARCLTIIVTHSTCRNFLN